MVEYVSECAACPAEKTLLGRERRRLESLEVGQVERVARKKLGKKQRKRILLKEVAAITRKEEERRQSADWESQVEGGLSEEWEDGCRNSEVDKSQAGKNESAEDEKLEASDAVEGNSEVEGDAYTEEDRTAIRNEVSRDFNFERENAAVLRALARLSGNVRPRRWRQVDGRRYLA